jgi:hypothetical protein
MSGWLACQVIAWFDEAQSPKFPPLLLLVALRGGESDDAMALDYQGWAALIDQEGNVVDLVSASFIGDDRSWGGHVQAPLFNGPDWTDVTRVRLEDGSEGEIRLEEEASWTSDMQLLHGGTLRTAAVTGSGPLRLSPPS